MRTIIINLIEDDMIKNTAKISIEDADLTNPLEFALRGLETSTIAFDFELNCPVDPNVTIGDFFSTNETVNLYGRISPDSSFTEEEDKFDHYTGFSLESPPIPEPTTEFQATTSLELKQQQLINSFRKELAEIACADLPLKAHKELKNALDSILPQTDFECFMSNALGVIPEEVKEDEETQIKMLSLIDTYRSKAAILTDEESQHFTLFPT